MRRYLFLSELATQNILYNKIRYCAVIEFLPLDDAVASNAVFVIVSMSGERACGNVLQPAKQLRNGQR